MIIELLLVAILGLMIGSFLGAWTYRLPREISIAQGRSFCPYCSHMLSWYDNIPLLSFLFLGGKCHYCRKPISTRYPIIEAITSISFLLVFLFLNQTTMVIPWLPESQLVSFGLIAAITALLIGVFVVDYEYQIIPDEINFILLLVTTTAIILSGTSAFWTHILSGFGAAAFLLALNLITKGRGMGLGDVKLAIPVGIFFGFPLVISWTFGAFFIGSIIGVLLIVTKAAHLKSRLAFGPFLVISFFVVLLWGDRLVNLVVPLW